MLNRTDVTYRTEKTVKPLLCWLCQDFVDPKADPDHIYLELNKHPLAYRTHYKCFYELFGNFCLFAYAALSDGSVEQKRAA